MPEVAQSQKDPGSARNVSTFLIIGGMLSLLLAWVSQQVLYEKWREDLSDIWINESIFNTYESTHRIFELLVRIAPEQYRDNILDIASHHYWQGLKFLSDQIPPNEYDAAYGSTDELGTPEPDLVILGDYQWDSKRILKNRDAIQRHFDTRKDDVARKKAYSRIAFWLLYVIGSTAWILGNTLRLQREGMPEEHEGIPGGG